jgi:hypothetical protein
LAHRVAHHLASGEALASFVVRHSCDNRPCCNPAHLLSGTHQDNSDDARSRGRCATGERNGRVKITAEIAAYIRGNPVGIKTCDLATLYGISEWTVNAIKRGEIWKS